MYMEISNTQHNINFGQKVPTRAFLKSALKTQNFEEAKELNLSLGIKYSGHIGFHKRALLIAENACKKNKKIQEMVKHLKENPFTQKEEIEKITKQTKGFLDIDI